MSKLNVDQKTIKNLLSDNKADFLIPDYQRPYAWDAEKECFTLWEDVFAFAIPEGDADKFDRTTAEYYLGPIVTFKNDNGQNNYNFYNGRPITKSMLVWWCMHDKNQERPSLDTVFEIEHIYARNRYDLEKSLSSKEMVEKLGNKSILEKRINIRASDFRFGDKMKYYNGYTTSKGDEKKATCVEELKQLAKSKTDFAEADIKERTTTILETFGKFLDEQGLIK